MNVKVNVKVNVSAGGKVIVRLMPALAAGQMELAGIFLSCTTNKRYLFFIWLECAGVLQVNIR